MRLVSRYDTAFKPKKVFRSLHLGRRVRIALPAQVPLGKLYQHVLVLRDTQLRPRSTHYWGGRGGVREDNVE